jgi:hypothetical protein
MSAPIEDRGLADETPSHLIETPATPPGSEDPGHTSVIARIRGPS